jgi:hypothetical protein
MSVSEEIRLKGRYRIVIERPPEHLRARHNALQFGALKLEQQGQLLQAEKLFRQAAAIRSQGRATVLEFPNVVTDEGARYILDNALAGSGYTSAMYMLIVAGTGYTAVATSDTAAQINGTNGWKEAGGTNSPTYSGNRKTVSWSAASSRSKSATTTSFTFTNSTPAYMKGVGMATTNTKDGGTGALISVGLSTAGDDLVKNGDVANVTYSMSA